jgi:hypothetical protein
MPDDKWMQARLNEIANALQADEGSVARLLRDLIGTVQVFRVVPVGKKFGYQQLRFRICGWKIVCEALRTELPPGIVDVIDKQQPAGGSLSPEFVLNVGGPHKLDILAPRIAEMRAHGMKWKDIALETEISADLAFHCWSRYMKGLGKGLPESLDDHHDDRLNDDQGAA